MKQILLSLLFLIAAARGPALGAELNFSLYSLGIPVAESTMLVDLAGSRFRMGLRYHVTGVARLFSGDKLDEVTTGYVNDGKPAPVEYRSAITLKGRDRMVTLDFHDGSPTIAAIDPPNASERDEVPPPRLARAIDPMTAMVSMIMAVTQTGKCELSHETFDGRRLELFYARTAGEEDLPVNSHSTFSGRALRCDYVSKPLAGFLTGSGREEDARPRQGTIWLAHTLPGGPLLPVRALVDSRFLGQATMYLTSVSP